MSFNVVGQFCQRKNDVGFCPDKVMWRGAGSELGLGLGSNVIFWVVFDGGFLIRLEAHVGQMIFPVFHTVF